jgi:hypothetical protein
MPKQLRLLFLAALALALANPISGIAHAQSARPQTIPALREWVPAAGVFQMSGGSRILVRTPALLPDADPGTEPG